MMKQYIYIGFGLLAVGLGVLGVVVPERRHLPAAETAVYPSGWCRNGRNAGVL